MKQFLFLSCLMITSAMAQDFLIEEIPLEQPAASQLQVEERISSGNNSSLDDVYTLLEEQKKVLRDFTERLEQTEHRLKQTEDNLERIQQDLTFRVTELENKPVSVIDKSSDKDRYNYAYDLLQKGNYAQAEQEFLAFLKDFEKSDLKPNALYWLGETYYAQKQFEKAVGQFADVFTKHAQSNKAPDALLKMGLSMLALNQEKEACTAFLALPNEYPKASQSLKDRAMEEAKKHTCS